MFVLNWILCKIWNFFVHIWFFWKKSIIWKQNQKKNNKKHFFSFQFFFAFEKGRGRNKDLVTKILPLFILPFLIQSAVVPFLVSTLKLLLIKSIVVGKIAIFLLLLSAFKNHVKYGYEAGPQFYPDVPNRRSEAHLTGYRVEGKPATWIN